MSGEPDNGKVFAPPASETGLYIGITGEPGNNSDNIPQYTDPARSYNPLLWLNMYSDPIKEALNSNSNNRIVWTQYSFYLNNSEPAIWNFFSVDGQWPGGEQPAWSSWQNIMYPYTSTNFYLAPADHSEPDITKNSFDLNFLFAKVEEPEQKNGLISGSIIPTDKDWNFVYGSNNKFIANKIKTYGEPEPTGTKPASGNCQNKLKGIYFQITFSDWDVFSEPTVDYNYGIPNQYLRPVISDEYANDPPVLAALPDGININFEPQFEPGPQPYQEDMYAFLIKYHKITIRGEPTGSP